MSSGTNIQGTSGADVTPIIDVPDPHPDVPPSDDSDGFDSSRNANEAQEQYNEILNEVEGKLPEFHSEEIKAAARKVIDTCRREFNAFIAQGANASPSQALVLVMITKGAEDEIQASEAKGGRCRQRNLASYREAACESAYTFLDSAC